MKKIFYLFVLSTLIFFTACQSTKNAAIKETAAQNENQLDGYKAENQLSELNQNQSPALQNPDIQEEAKDTIKLLFGGDIMAHTVNYQITTYAKIWRDVKYITSDADLSFANIEAPIDTTRPASSYPNFNMTQKYVQAAVDAGFDVFSLCNNHSNDQYLNGIKETIKSTARITDYAAQNGNKIYFAGLKETPESSFTYNLIEKNGWKILFLPVTELLNRPDYSSYINYIKTDDVARTDFIRFIKELKAKNPCDLFVISLHTSEPEYTRAVTSRQDQFYMDLLAAGVDIVWCNHAHIIKNRKIVVDTKLNRDKIIMYANGNTISGQRTKPELTSKNPTGERDNTGDGLLYKVILKKDNKGSVKIQKAEPVFITTYINTANEFVLKPLNQDFVDYLNDVPRTNWAKYIERRIKINEEATKDYIEWQ